MKKILTIAIALLTFTTANAQAPSVKETVKATVSVQSSTDANVQTPVAIPAEETPANDATAVGAPDNSARFVGTNDLNLYLLRAGIKKA